MQQDATIEELFAIHRQLDTKREGCAQFDDRAHLRAQGKDGGQR